MLPLICVLLVVSAYGAHIPQGHLEPKIVGGVDIPIDVTPYQVSVRFNNDHVCGGTIINEDSVLTVAHCTNGRNASSFSIKGGVAQLNGNGIVFGVSKIIQHEYFSPSRLDYDISILKLDGSMTYSAYMQPIVMQAQGDEVPNDYVGMISGWGAVGEEMGLSNNLQLAMTKTYDYMTCRRDYNNFIQVTENMICVEMPGVGTCQGDSGSPLSVDDRLVGLSSWSRGCARPNNPSVFTKISAVRSWIDEHAYDL